MLISSHRVNSNTKMKSNPFANKNLSSTKSKDISEKYENYEKSNKIHNYNHIQLNSFSSLDMNLCNGHWLFCILNIVSKG